MNTVIAIMVLALVVAAIAALLEHTHRREEAYPHRWVPPARTPTPTPTSSASCTTSTPAPEARPLPSGTATLVA